MLGQTIATTKLQKHQWMFTRVNIPNQNSTSMTDDRCQGHVSHVPVERSRDRDRFSHGSDVPHDCVSQDQPILSHGSQTRHDCFSFSDDVGNGHLKNKIWAAVGLPPHASPPQQQTSVSVASSNGTTTMASSGTRQLRQEEGQHCVISVPQMTVDECRNVKWDDQWLPPCSS